MKKITCLILAIIMSFGIISISSHAEGETATDFSEEMEALRILDVIPDYYDYNTNFQKEVTRADFVDCVAKLINMKPANRNQIYYYDVPENHYAYEAISLLTEMGIIKGTGENLFKPDDLIEKVAAYKILLSVMGYASMAEIKGGYPNGYLALASELEISDRASDSKYLTYGDMFIVLYDALAVNIAVPKSAASGYIQYEVLEDETLISRYRDIYKEEGILNGANMISLNDVSLRTENEVIIGDTIYYSEIDLSDMLGEEIEYFVKKNSKTEDGTILWARTTNDSEVLTIDAEDIVSFDSKTYILKYYVGNKTKTYQLDKGISIIYNGREIGSDIEKAFISQSGEVKIVENNNVCTAAIIKAYEDFVVGSTNIATNTIYDKRGAGYKLVIDEKKVDYSSFKTVSGADVKFSDIVADMVLSVCASRDGEYIDVIVSSEKVTGILSKVSDSDKGSLLTVDGREYLLKDKTQQVPSVGSQVELYLNFEGDAVYIEKTASTLMAAYIKSIALVDNDVRMALRLKVFTENGEHLTVFAAEKTFVDGKLEKDPEIMFKAIGQNPQFVMLKINEQKEITMIDTQKVNEPYESEKSSLSLSTVRSGTWVRGSGSFNKMSVVNANTKYIGIPSEINESTPDDAYSLPGRPSNDSTYSIETYKTTDRVGYEEYILVFGGAGASLDDNLPVVVEKVGTGVGPDGDVGECIWGYQGKNEVMLMSDGKVSFKGMGVDKGMIVRFANDQSGYVTAAEIIFDINNKESYITKSENFRYAAEYSCSIGYLHDVVDGVPSISWSDIKTVDHRVAPYTAPVLVYDTSVTKDNISVGSLSDGITAYDAGEDCSLIVAIEESAHAQLFVLYN